MFHITQWGLPSPLLGFQTMLRVASTKILGSTIRTDVQLHPWLACNFQQRSKIRIATYTHIKLVQVKPC